MRSVTVIPGFLLLLLSLLVVRESEAQQFNFSSRNFSSRKNIADIKTHGFPDTVKIEDALWTSGISTSLVKTKSVHDMIRFYVNHDSNTVASPYQYKMCVTVFGYPYPGANPGSGLDDTLTINYDRGLPGLTAHNAYQDFYVSKYSNFHKILVVINDILSIPSDTSDPPVSISTLSPLPGYNCAVEAEIWQQHYFKYPYGGSYPTSYLSSSYLGSESALKVNFWSPTSDSIPTPAMYELEWTYLDDYNFHLSTGTWDTLGTSQLNYDFKNNATRVITDQLSYKIPLVYERGYVVFRARIVRPDSNAYDIPVYTDWSITSNTGTLSSFTSNQSKYYFHIPKSHKNDSLNWKYTVSFAEEGKYKQVLSYFDGSLKNRQTITRFNSEPDKLIATENIYDYKGRPAISILPTPVSSTGFQYVYGLSLNSATSKPYTAADFDTLQPAHTCPNEFSLSPLATSALASKYYSTANYDTANFQKFVPDAKGYPLVHTLIAPENDKKILKQGGAGDKLQMGGGHITRYDYVTPQQSELNRLFGTEIGRAEYYQKTVVRDPNTQAAYEISDYQGKKIATGMIGLGPDTSVYPIDSMVLPGLTSITEDLLDGIQQTPVDYTWSLNKSFYVERDGQHTLQYVLTVPPYQICSKYLTVAASYNYELFDDCGNLDTQKSEVLGTTNMFASSPGSGVNTGAVVSTYLYTGKHILNKTMSISYDSVSAAVDSFMLKAGYPCVLDENYFIRKAIESKQFPCPLDTSDPCEVKRRQMMAELYPGKKYGAYVKGTNGGMDSLATYTASPNNSIFDIDGSGIFRYQQCASIPFPDTVKYMGVKYWDIKDLPVNTFIMIFDTSIARALLPLHPEFCRKCSSAEEHYEDFLNSIHDYQTAIQLGYFSLDSLVLKDPVYTNANALYDSLVHINHTSLRIDTLCIDLAFCGGIDSTQLRTCMEQIFHAQTSNNYDINNAPALVKDAYWRKLLPLYIGNRRLRMLQWQSKDTVSRCAPCAANRLNLTPDPVYGPAIVSIPGSGLSDSTTLAQFFDDSSNGTTVPAWVTSLIANGSSFSPNVLDSLQTLYNSSQTSLCDSQVAQMARALTNCSTDTNKIKAIRDSLHNYYCVGSGAGKPFTPDVIRRIIVNNGLSLGDLCNPYIVNMAPFPIPNMDLGALTCKPQAFFLDSKGFFNSTAAHGSINGLSTLHDTLSTANILENAMIGVLGTSYVDISSTYQTSAKTYQISVASQSNPSLKLGFWLKKMDQDTICTRRLDSLNYWTIKDIFCLKADASNVFPSLINKNTFTARILGVKGTDTVICDVLGWTDTIAMLDEQAADKQICITCPEIRRTYAAFKDTLSAYGVCCTDHPYYGLMLAHFLNFTLARQYSVTQVEDFIASCALADSTPFRRLYGQVRLTGLSHSTAQTVINTLNTTFNTSVNFFKYRQNGINRLIIYFDNIPTDKLLAAKNIVNGYTAYSPVYGATLAGDTAAIVFVPSQLTVSLPTATGITIGSSTNAQVYYSAISSTTSVAYKRYNITHSPTMKEWALVQYTMALENYLYSHAYGSQAFTKCDPFVNSDYALSEKKDFLSYNYGLSDTLSHSDLIKKLQEDTLKIRVYNSGSNATGTNYTNTDVTYTSPYVNKDYSDLFVTPNNQSSNAGFQRVGQILSLISAGNGGHVFFSAVSTSIPITSNTSQLGTTDNLKVFRCGDNKTFWFRLFKANPSNVLYDLYIKVPDYIESPTQLTYVGTELAQGDGGVFRLKIRFTGPNSSNVYCYAYTDFPVGTGKMLENSLLCRSMYDSWDVPDTMACERYKLNVAINEGRQMYLHYRDSVRKKYIADYTAYLDTAVHEQLWLRTRDQKYQFTLYYYDRAGNLIRVVPPGGVNRMDTTTNALVNSDRAASVISSSSMPQHEMSTFYKYNSLNKKTQEISPDAGTTNYFYDAIGRIVFSQTAAQEFVQKVGYVLYDEQGRIVETGQGPYVQQVTCQNCVAPLLPQVSNSTNYNLDQLRDFILSKKREEVSATKYDEEDKNLGSIERMTRQANLRKRVAVLKYFEKLPAYARGDTAKTYDFATHYSYDMSGNVKTMTHEFVKITIPEMRFKRIDYDYDMLSGKVNMLTYSRGSTDQYYHRYSYDADNRIIKAETSPDGVYWDDDADYKYYQHGPLARAELGDLRLQGLDYAYTIQGWIKAMNSDFIDSTYDMGKDGMPSSMFLNDVFGYSLSYFNGDYSPIAHTKVMHIPDSAKSLYNGNIARQTTSLRYFDNLKKEYRYDPLNRLKNAQYYSVTLDTAGNTVNPITAYRNSYQYDANGNLTKLMRMGAPISGGPYTMDSFTYQFTSPYRNQIDNVYDDADQANHYQTDIPFEGSGGLPTSRIGHDASGRISDDLINGCDSMIWSMYDKMKHVNLASGVRMDFFYDGAGNRVEQITTFPEDDDGYFRRQHEYYVRDNDGNILAILKYDEALASEWKALHAVEEITSATPEITPAVIAGMFKTSASFSSGVIDQTLENPELADTIIGQLGPSEYLSQDMNLYFGINLDDVAGELDTLRYGGAIDILSRSLKKEASLDLVSTMFRDYDHADIALDSWIAVWEDGFDSLCSALQVTPVKESVLDYYLKDSSFVMQQISWLISSQDDSTPIELIKSWTTDAELNDLDLPDNLAGTWIDKQWQALQRYVAKDENIADRDSLISVISSSPDAMDRLRANIGDRAMLEARYNNSPDSFLAKYTASLGEDGVGDALDEVQGMSAGYLAQHLIDQHQTPELAGYYTDVIKAEDFYLAEHHFYGNKRLGIKYYWMPMGWYWNQYTGYQSSQNVWLTHRVPWYSRVLGDFMQPVATEPKWDSVDYSHWFTSRLLGTKRFELTDYLGNVQSVIFDRWTPRTSGSTLLKYEPDVHLVMDYYPYGMIMKQGACDTCEDAEVSNTGPVNSLKLSETNDPLTPGSYPPQTANQIGNWAIAPSTGTALSHGSMTWEGNGGAMKFLCTAYLAGHVTELGMAAAIETDSGVRYRVLFETDNATAGELKVRMIAYSDASRGGYSTLSSTTAASSGNYSISFTASSDTTWFWIGHDYETGFEGGSGFKVTSASMARYTWTATQIAVQSMLSNWKTPYRFAYNGIQRIDQMKGELNHYSALYGEYDPRAVVRGNLDPKSVNGVSPYSMFQGNPIVFSDVLLDTNSYDVNGTTGVVKQTDTKGGDKTDYVHLHYDGHPANVAETTAKEPVVLPPGLNGMPAGDYEMPVRTVDAQGKGFGNNSREPGVLYKGAPWSGRTETVDDPFTSIGAGLVYGLGRTVIRRITAETVTPVLEGAVKSNFARFVSKMPANAKPSASFQLLDDGNYLFQATSPGRVPGSSALYQKWVNPQGETFKMIKTTFAPNGSIIHVKQKL